MRQTRFSLAFAFLLGGVFALISCVNPLEPPSGKIEPKRNFWAIWIDNEMEQRWYSCPSSLLATGACCLVYGEDKLNIPVSFAEDVAAEFDNSVYSKITGAFGHPSDLDKNGKVIILLHKIEEPGGGNSYTAGYFNANDLLYNSYSNRGEMLYINYKPSYTNQLYSTMAHELQHLINCSLHPDKPMDLWIDEGLASAAEYLYGGPQIDRIWHFNSDQQQTIQKGNNFFIWEGYWEDYLREDDQPVDQLANYSTAYLFFQWLRIHAANGSGIYRDIINSSSLDYQAVTDAAKNSISAFSGISNDEAGWAKLLGAWYAANYAANRFANPPSGAEDGIYGYGGEITLNFNWSYPDPENTHNAPLYPGEGVYSGITGSSNKSPTTGSPHIRYLGLNGSTVDSDPPYDTQYLLTYNGAVTGASWETGYVADTVPVMSLFGAMAAESGGMTETPEAILRRWDGGRVFLEKMQGAGTLPPVE
jgi:hypothetical protein